MLISRNVPSAALLTVCLYPDSAFVTVTSASPIVAPVGSVTSPVIVPAFPSDCPCAMKPANTSPSAISPAHARHSFSARAASPNRARQQADLPTNTTAVINLVIQPQYRGLSRHQLAECHERARIAGRRSGARRQRTAPFFPWELFTICNVLVPKEYSLAWAIWRKISVSPRDPSENHLSLSQLQSFPWLSASARTRPSSLSWTSSFCASCP